jgi:hypothetical protein
VLAVLAVRTDEVMGRRGEEATSPTATHLRIDLRRASAAGSPSSGRREQIGGGRSPPSLSPVLGFLRRREPVLGPARADPAAGGRLRRCRPSSGPPSAGARRRAGKSGSGRGRPPPPLPPVLGFFRRREPCPRAGERGSGGGRPPLPSGALSPGRRVRIRRREAASATGSPSSGRRRLSSGGAVGGGGGGCGPQRRGRRR